MGRHEEQPAEAAAAVSAAAHDLALATRRFDDLDEVYQVLGDLQVTLIDVHQSLQQLARTHSANRETVTADGPHPELGPEYADHAAACLTKAAARVDAATTELMTGYSASGHLIWKPAVRVAEILTERAADLHTDPATPAAEPPPDHGLTR